MGVGSRVKAAINISYVLWIWEPTCRLLKRFTSLVTLFLLKGVVRKITS